MTSNNRRRDLAEASQTPPTLASVPVREDDIEPTMGLTWVSWLFRAMSVLLFLLMVIQIALGLTSAVEISYGVLFAEAVRLLIFAGLLWAAGALSTLFVRMHDDARAARVLLARIAYRLRNDSAQAPVPPAGEVPRERDDAGYRH